MTGRIARWSAVILPVLGGWWAHLDRTVPNPPHRAEWLSVDGVRLRSVRAGNGEPTLVLLHGYGESLTTWRSVFDRLAEGHRVVALDLPGSGGSEKPDSSYSLPALTERISRFLDTWTKGPIVIVGHSMGGEVAASLALARPDRIERVILIAPAGYRIGLGGIMETMNPGRARTIGKYLALRSFITPIHDPGWMYEPDSMARYDLTEDPAYSRAATRVLEEFDFMGLRDRFKDITQPTLLIWGGLDPVVPFSVGDTLSRTIPCVRYVPLPKAFHRPQAEVPDTVIAEMLSFLKGQREGVSEKGTACRAVPSRFSLIPSRWIVAANATILAAYSNLTIRREGASGPAQLSPCSGHLAARTRQRNHPAQDPSRARLQPRTSSARSLRGR